MGSSRKSDKRRSKSAKVSNAVIGGTFHGHTIQAGTAHVTVHDHRSGSVLRTSASPLPPLPPLPVAFTGRDRDVGDILASLAPDGVSGGDFSGLMLTGLGGIGKTTAAIAAGRAAMDRGWFRGVLFVDMRGYDDTCMEAGQALDTLLRMLGVPAENIPPDTEARAAFLRAELDRSESGVLVIADNVSSARQVIPLRPASARHRLLVTSREILPGLGARVLRLGLLDPGAARDLMASEVRAAWPHDDRVAADPDGALLVAELCGYLPLALRLAAAQLIVDQHLQLGWLAKDLTDSAGRLDLLQDGETGIRLTLDSSHRRLSVSQAELFRLLALNPGPEISTVAAAVLAGRTLRETRIMLAQLARTALVSQTPDGGRWYLHDLVHVFAAERAQMHPEPSRQARRRLLEFYVAAAGAANDSVTALPDSPPELGVFHDRSHALTWMDRERPNLVGTVQAAVATNHPELVTELAPALGSYLIRRFRTDDGLTVTRAALDAARALDSTSDEAAAWNNFGLALHEARRFDEAAEAFGRSGELFRQCGNRRGESSAQGNLANSLRKVRRFDEALAAHQHALAIDRELGHRRREGGTLNNIAATLQDMRRFDEAIEILECARDIHRELGDVDGEATVWSNLAMAMGETRRFDEAVEAGRHSARLARDLGDPHLEATALEEIGAVFQMTGRFEEAIAIHQKTCIGFRELGDRHGEALSWGNLGLALGAVRRFEEAVDAHEKALAIHLELGDRHDWARTCGNLGAALNGLGRFEEAEDVLRPALAVFQERGDRHGESAVWNNLGAVLEEAGRRGEAIQAHQEALRAVQEVGDRPAESRSLTNLGDVLREAGHVGAAIAAHEQALEIHRALGDRHGEAKLQDKLGLDFGEGGDHQAAADAFQRARRLYLDLGDEDGEAVALLGQADALCSRSGFQEAADAAREALVLFRRLGSADGEAAAWYCLGDALHGVGETAEAETALRRAETCGQVLDADGDDGSGADAVAD
ncbi:tetratricopeptide repeat protein [Kitasatospora sp. NPDC057936]|uniref:tetratricopeptide repeat protein n=1 Tax=Kitasatospora sp. NPDC057936 TaxID=3346283 RepID=UPI0036DE98ED